MNFKSQINKFFFYNFPLVLFCLIPFFLITGPFLSDLSVSVISLIFLISCIKEKNFSYFKKKYFYFFLIFWFYLLINSLINNFNLDSLIISLFYIRYGIFVIAIATLLDTSNKFIKYFFYCILICFLALIIDGYYQYFYGENILGWKGSDRTSSFFKDENILGSYLSRIWPIFFGLYIILFKKENYTYYLLIVVFILCETLVFLSGDRTAFFYINLSAFFVIIFSQKLLKLRLFTLVSSLILILAISIFNPTAKERVVDLTLEQMNIASGASDMYFFSEAHHELYISAYKIFQDNIILGAGVKNFRNICKNPKYYVDMEEKCNTHPHNTYIQILSETGIIGFIFLIFCLVYFIINVFKHLILKFKGKYYFNDFEICLLSGLAIYLWPFAPTGNVFSNWLNILMIINLPFLIWSRKTDKI